MVVPAVVVNEKGAVNEASNVPAAAEVGGGLTDGAPGVTIAEGTINDA